MKNRLDFIRYGSPYFTYLSSAFVMSNVFGMFIGDTAAMASFTVTSIIIFISLFWLSDAAVALNGKMSHLPLLLMLASVAVSTVFEISRALRMFSAASDYSSSKLGNYIFALAVIAVSVICALGGTYTVLKTSNIFFIIPATVLILVICSFFAHGVKFTATDFFVSDNLSKSILTGFISASVLCSDCFIILYMQKREKCYIKKYACGAFAISLIFIVALSVLFGGLFGNTLYAKLFFPTLSAVGLFRGLAFEEIIILAASVCMLYRFTSRLCFSYSVLKILTPKRDSVLRLLIFLASALASTVGTSVFLSGRYYSVQNYAVGFLFLLSFVIIPPLMGFLRKNKH